MTGQLLMSRRLSKWCTHLRKISDYHLSSMLHGSVNGADTPVYPVLNMTLTMGISHNEEHSAPTHCKSQKKKKKKHKLTFVTLGF